MAGRPSTDPAARDRSVRTVRVVAWATGLAAAGLTALFSGVAAHAFRGHDGKAKTASPARSSRPLARMRVPAPQHVPAISGAPAELQPPAQPPAAAPAPAPAEQVPPAEQAPQQSGGS
jgi:hypothetical protein